MVQWKGYPKEEATWESEANLTNSQELLREYQERQSSSPPLSRKRAKYAEATTEDDASQQEAQLPEAITQDNQSQQRPQVTQGAKDRRLLQGPASLQNKAQHVFWDNDRGGTRIVAESELFPQNEQGTSSSRKPKDSPSEERKSNVAKKVESSSTGDSKSNSVAETGNGPTGEVGKVSGEDGVRDTSVQGPLEDVGGNPTGEEGYAVPEDMMNDAAVKGPVEEDRTN
ncbi:MAG: hypothetical protein Q9184_001789 [Pyrenodesmia sp. 2 TL-2023]